jgi:hypothetical protein
MRCIIDKLIRYFILKNAAFADIRRIKKDKKDKKR